MWFMFTDTLVILFHALTYCPSPSYRQTIPTKSTTTGSSFEIDDQLSDGHCKYGYYRSIVPK